MKSIQKDLIFVCISSILIIFGLLMDISAIGAGIAVLFFLFALRSKEYGLLMLVVFIATRPFLIAVNPGFKIVGDLLILGLLIRTVFDYRKELKKLFIFHPFELAFFAFCAIGTVSAFLTGVEIAAIIIQLRAYLLFYIVFYVVRRMEICEPFIKHFVSMTFFMGILLSLHGWVEKISDKTLLMPGEWRDWYLSYTNQIRVYGLLKGPNELALFLLVAFIVSLYLVKHLQGKHRYYVYAGLSVIGSTILLTYSRGALLCLAVFIAMYILLSRKIRVFVPIILVVLMSGGLFMGINKAADYYYDVYLQSADDKDHDKNHGSKRFKDAFSEETLEQSGQSGRIYYVQKSVEIFKDHPIIGTGFATFGGSGSLKYFSPVYDDYNIDRQFYSDNQYILILAETGLVGLLFVMIVAGSLIAFTLKIRKKIYFASMLMFLIVAVIVGGLVYNILENDSFMLYFFAIFGYAFHFNDIHFNKGELS